MEVLRGLAEEVPEEQRVHRRAGTAEGAGLEPDPPGEPAAARGVDGIGVDDEVLGQPVEQRQVDLAAVERVPAALLPEEEVLLDADGPEDRDLPGGAET